MRRYTFLSLIGFILFTLIANQAKSTEKISTISINSGNFWHFTLDKRFRDFYRQVFIDKFEIMIHAVNVSQYTYCVKKGICPSIPLLKLKYIYPEYNNNLEEIMTIAEKDNRTIVFVTYDEAITYCNSIGMRLPTGAEWTKAARGSSDKRDFPWGNEIIEPLCKEQKTLEESQISLFVDNYPPGPYGVHDMVGNVQEWTLSLWNKNYDHVMPNRNPLCTEAIFNSLPYDKDSTANDRIVKGSICLASPLVDGGSLVSRFKRSPDLGFRCVRSPLMKPEDFNH